MPGRRQVNYLPPAMIEDDKHIQRRKVDRGDGEEVYLPGHPHMVPQERQPSR